jgi:uroporphyrinogen-III synthase
MRFSHVFISRPQHEAEELAAMLEGLGLRAVVQPAFDYQPLDAGADAPESFDELETARSSDLLVFTSPRAVSLGLPQLPREVLLYARVAAIGPATAQALAASGIPVGVTARTGYTSEDLLETLAGEPVKASNARPAAFIIAAPGGREALADGLARLGWRVRFIMVYKPVPAELDRAALSALADAAGLLSVWTSCNAMTALAHRLPTAIWFQICQGDWLVISERLRRLSRAFGPSRIHLSSGPGNGAILAAIRALL